MKITKEITFDSAHMLSYYDGKCANLHGHTYKLQVTVEDEVNLETNMIIDFNDLKNALDETVIRYFDHALVFSGANVREESENELLKWAIKYERRFFELQSGKTTCENMAPMIRDMIQNHLSCHHKNIKVSVRLWETPTSFVEC